MAGQWQVRVPSSRVGGVALALMFAAGCAATTPSPPAPEEYLLVLNAGDASITRLPLTGSSFPVPIPLGNLGGTAYALAARGSQGLVTTGAGSTVAVLNLADEESVLLYPLARDGGAAGAAFANDSIAYIANPFNHRVTRLNLRSGDTSSVAVGRTPSAIAVTRGRVFVANANLTDSCDHVPPCVAGPSWLSVIDPERNAVVDSIGLPGPGNAGAVTVGGDGLLYVMSAGPGGEDAGRLSIVDPVLRQEVGSFSGFGSLPGQLASDGRERLFVTSLDHGLMEFNTRTRRLVRGAGAGIPLTDLVDAAVDENGLVYGVEAGGCAPPAAGRIRIFRPDLTEARIVLAGPCSVDAVIVRLLLEP